MEFAAITIKTELFGDDPLKETSSKKKKKQTYRCPTCSMLFEDNEEAVEHLLTHSELKLKKNHCLKCGRQCADADDYAQHRLTHRKIRPYQCPFCGVQFAALHSLNIHIAKHDDDNKLTCSVCNKTFPHRYDLKQHSKVHEDVGREYECIYCKKQFHALVSLQRHNRTHLDERRFQCAICDKRFQRSTHYKVHLRVHIGGNKIKCPICGQLLGNKQSVQRHMKRVHEPKQANANTNGKLVTVAVAGVASHACEFCPEKFQLRKELTVHRDGHKLPCPTCGKIFLGPARLKRHTDDHERVLTCTICAMTFTRKHGLEQHMEIVHKDDPPQKCNFCPAVLYKHNIKVHMAKHSGAKIYQCELDGCGKEFLHASSYFRHKVSHTGTRRFECEVCGKKSLQQGHHVRHMMLHADPTIPCSICKKKFHFMQEYKKHMRRTHSSENPFLCDQCGGTFSSEQRRTKHMKEVHNIFEVRNEKKAKTPAMASASKAVVQQEPDENVHFESIEVLDGMTLDDDMDADDDHHHFDDDFASMDELETPNFPNVSMDNSRLFDDGFDENRAIDLKITYDHPYVGGGGGDDDDSDDDEVNPKTEIDDNIIESKYLPEEYFCAVCCKKFDSSGAYQAHVDTHKERVDAYCADCNTKFNQQSAYELHLWYHKNEQPAACEYCMKPLYSDTFELHMITHSGPHPWHCKICGHKCLNGEMYEKHMERKHGDDRTMQCPMCPKKFALKTHFTRHTRIHMAQRMFVCTICKRQFYDLKRFKGHMKRIHKLEQAFGCTRCKLRFNEEAELEEHSNDCVDAATNHSEDQKGFGCAHCSARFTERDEIIKHMEKHAAGTEDADNIDPMYCETCGKKFTKKTLYDRHIRIHLAQKPYTCEVCNKGFLDKKTYRKHLSRHDKKNIFPCTKCNRTFTSRSDLRVHLLIHEGRSPFRCEECQKTFKYSNSLARHKRAHAGIKNYKCKICQRDFLQSGHLNEHMKTHVEGSQHLCTICDRSFKLMLSFKRHMRKVHSSVRPFLCEKCGDGFSDEKKRDEHAAKHETENTEDDE